MALKKKSKIIILILIICLIIGIVLSFYIKLKNSYIFMIKNAFVKTINASSTEFSLEYEENDDKTNVDGIIEYNFKELELVADAIYNDENIILDVSREKSTISYLVKTFDKWITIDVTDIASEILDKIENIGEKSIYESFPVQNILKLANIDDIIDTSKYPDKLSQKFVINFLSDSFCKSVLRLEEENENDLIIYSVNPNIYELLKKFIKNSNLTQEEEKELEEELEKNKSKLEEINLTLSISINKDGYIEEFLFIQKENEDIKSINLRLNNFNNVSIE